MLDDGLLLQPSVNSPQQVIQRNSLSLGGSVSDPGSTEDGARKAPGHN